MLFFQIKWKINGSIKLSIHGSVSVKLDLLNLLADNLTLQMSLETSLRLLTLFIHAETGLVHSTNSQLQG